MNHPSMKMSVVFINNRCFSKEAILNCIIRLCATSSLILAFNKPGELILK